MVEVLRPGIFVNEVVSPASVEALSTSTAAMVGITERGPVDEADLVTSYGQFVSKYGGYYNGSALPYAVEEFFSEGGGRLWVSRIVEAGVAATVTTLTLNAQIVWTAAETGEIGNDITVALVDPGGATQPLSVSVSGKAITVSLATDGGSAIISTANDVIAAVQASADASYLVTVGTGTGDGTTVQSAVAATNLAGGAGAFQARRRQVDIEETNNSVEIKALHPGQFGNGLGYTTAKYQYALAADLVTGATEASLTSINGIERGDIVHIDDGTTSCIVKVFSINVTDRKITFPAVTLGLTIASATSIVKSGSNHRASTTLAASLANGATTATLTSGTNFKVGQRVTFSDGTNEGSVVVTGVNGNVLSFSAITLSGTLPATTTIAVSQEFQLSVLDESATVEGPFEFLSMEDTNQADYIETRLYGDGNESSLVQVTDLDSATSAGENHTPFPVVNTLLADGEDGGTPGNTDFIGSSVSPKTGIYLFDEVEDINFIGTPGNTAVAVVSNGINYAEGRGDMEYISSTPLADDEPVEALEYRNVELNKDSRYGCLYYPWLKFNDPEVDGNILQLAPDGTVMGQWADVARTVGIQRAPANIPLGRAVGVTYDISDGEHELLNPAGINAIRVFPGEGIRIYGARTLQSNKNGLHFIPPARIINYIKKGLLTLNRGFVFEAISQDLFREIDAVNSDFLSGLWSQGWLFPTDDPTQAFFVNVSGETTTSADIAQGRVNVEIGVNPVKPAEAIVFKLAVASGSASVQELF